MKWDAAIMWFADCLVGLTVPDSRAAEIIGDLHERAEEELSGGYRPARVSWRYLHHAMSVVLHFSWRAAVRRVRHGVARAARHARPGNRNGGAWGVIHDGRLAVRALIRRPAFSLVVIATLALGAGANTAIFTVVRNVVLRPVPYPHPDGLASLWMEFRREPGVPGFEIVASEPEYIEFADAAQSFEAIAGFWVAAINLSGRDEPMRVKAAAVSANFFDVVGIAPEQGRLFLAGEDVPGAARVAVLTDGLWTRAFGRDPDLLGRTIVADGRSYEVVGIMPPGFSFPGADVDLLRPNYLDPTNLGGRSSHYLHLLGRLKPGVTPRAAQLEASVVSARLRELHPGLHGVSPRHPMIVASYQSKLTGPVRPALWVLSGAAALVLLIACANVANLMLARSEARGHEWAIRRALGAGRGRLIRHMLLESLVLSVLGGGIGLALSALAVPALASMGADHLPRSAAWRVDGVVIAFAAGLAIVTSLVSGLAPAVSGSGKPQAGLRERGATNPIRFRLRNGLLVSQLALAVVLLTGAGVLARNLLALMHVDPGLDPKGVVTMTFELDASRYQSQAAMADFHRRLDERLAAFPSVVSSGAIRSLPLAADGGFETVSATGARVASDESINAIYQIASPGYFAALSVPLLEGRLFGNADRAGTEPVVLINEATAGRYWPDGDAIGNSLQLGVSGANPNPVMRIVGIVGNVMQTGLGRTPTPQIFVPRSQAGANYGGLGTRTATLVVKGTVAPTLLIQQARAVFRELDPLIPLSDVQTMQSVVGRSLSDERFLSTLLGVFSGLALALAAIGVYGLMSYLVLQRTREIGVRMALGATRRRVVGDVVSRSVTVTSIGIALGLAAALAGSRLLDAFVTLVSARDPWVFGLGPLVLLGVAVVAAYGPARHAAAVDPMAAVRSE